MKLKTTYLNNTNKMKVIITYHEKKYSTSTDIKSEKVINKILVV